MTNAAARLDIILAAKNEASKVLKDAEKDVGGFGKALGDVGKIAAGFLAANVFAGAAQKVTGFFSDSVSAIKESIAVSAQLDTVIKSTGGAAGVTAKQVKDMAGNMEKLSLFEDEAIISSSSLLLTFTNIGKNVFPRAQQTVLDMSQALGQDLKSSSVQLGKALNDPIAGITALSRVGVSFTAEQKKMIEGMVNAGQIEKAQAVILKELETEFGGSARAASDAAGASEKLKDRMNDLKETIGAKLLPVQEKFKEVQIAVLDLLVMKVIPAAEAVGRVFADFSRYIQAVVSDGDTLNDWLTHLPGFLQPVAKVIGDITLAAIGLGNTLKTNIVDLFNNQVRPAFQTVIDLAGTLQHLFNLGLNGGKIGGEFSAMERAAFALGSLFRTTLIPAYNDARAAIGLLVLGLQGGDIGGKFTVLQEAAFTLGQSIRTDMLPFLRDVGTVITGTIIPAFITGAEEIGKHKEIVIPLIAAIGTAIVLALGPVSVAALAIVGIPILVSQVGDAFKDPILIAAIAALGVAIFVALGPGSQVLIAIGGLIVAIGLIADKWKEVKDFIYNNPIIGDIKIGGVNAGAGGLRKFLHGIGVPGYAVGTPYVPEDQLAYLHKGEAVIPAAMNQARPIIGVSPSINVNIYGPIYGMDDFEQRVGAAVANIKRRGGLAGFGAA